MSNGKIFPAFEQKNVPVIIPFDNLYAPYAGVFIQSLLDHVSKEYNYDIIIFEREISQENKRLLKSLAAGHTNVSIRFYDPATLMHSNCYDNEHPEHPVGSYLRLIAPHILNYHGRIIVTDPDMLLQTDIARLMDEDLGGACVAGVRDLTMIGMHLSDDTIPAIDMKLRDYFQTVCGLDDFRNYVNTGLLLFDRDNYVRELDMETVLNTVSQDRYFWAEQDALNVLMQGKIKHLDFAWNTILPLQQYIARSIETGAKLYDGDYERSYKNPYLLHWTGKPKPWVCPDVPYGGEWWQTALRTPFVGHIVARMADAQEKRRQHYREKYGKENVDIWDPSPKGIDRMQSP